jgi:hypothetical protein
MDKTRNFVLWLDGFLEATGDKLTTEQVKRIREKLDNIFEHVVEKDKEDNKPHHIPSSIFPSEGDAVYRC